MIRATLDTRNLMDQLSAINDLERQVDLAAGMCDWQLNNESRQESAGFYNDLCRFLDKKLLWQEGLLEAIWAKSQKERNVKILQWVSDIPYETDLSIVKDGRLHGTCQWLLEHPIYEEWLARSDSSVLWLHGIPGAGKTNLSSKVIDNIRHYYRWRDDVGIAYFFCDRNRRSHQDPQSILNSLVRQLSIARNHENIMACTAEIYGKKERAGFASDRLTWDESSSLLLQLVCVYKHTYIVIDGLDECDKDTRIKLIEALDGLVERNPRSVKLFIASRENEDIKNRYIQDSNLRIAAANQADIEKFVVSKIALNKRFSRNLSERVQGEILSTFSRKSQGMFMWAKLMIDGLLKLQLERDILQYLENLPQDLASAYDSIYRSIHEREGSAGEVANRAFQLIMCSERSFDPPSPETLARIISVDMEMYDPNSCKSQVSVDYILDVCHNLVEIVEAPSRTFRLAHLSVQEYFEASHWTRAQAHVFTARLCLRCLLDERKLHIDIINYALRWSEDWKRSGYNMEDVKLRVYLPRVFPGPFIPSPLYSDSAKGLFGDSEFTFTAKLYCVDPLQAPAFTCCFLGITDVIQRWFRSGSLRSADKKWIANKYLTLVVDRNHIEISKLFLELGADPNKGYASEYARPSLHLASRRGASHLEIINMLLKYGALPNLETDYFGTALDDALDGEEPLKVVRILERSGATLGADRRRRQELLEAIRS